MKNLGELPSHDHRSLNFQDDALFFAKDDISSGRKTSDDEFEQAMSRYLTRAVTEVDLASLMPKSRAYDEGRASARAGHSITENPFIETSERVHYLAWLEGFASFKPGDVSP